MAIRNTNTGGTDFVANETVYAEDLNDTFDSALVGNGLFKQATSTFTDNDTEQTFTDTFCTETSLVLITITSATAAQGIWTVVSGDGDFTITSTATEAADITFNYFIVKNY